MNLNRHPLYRRRRDKYSENTPYSTTIPTASDFLMTCRPLMISPPNRSRASAGRRRPNIRRPPQDELVVLALDDPGSNVEYGMEGQRRAGQGRKRPRIDGKDSGGGRSQETPPPMPTRVNRQSNTSWAALRRTLHERYRECLENGAAQASAAEASRRARFGDLANARGGYGKLLSPGLR